jgi:hypothetical protein
VPWMVATGFVIVIIGAPPSRVRSWRMTGW